MSNVELIAEARSRHYRLDGETNVCACDDDDWPCVTKQLADALEAAEVMNLPRYQPLPPGFKWHIGSCSYCGGRPA